MHSISVLGWRLHFNGDYSGSVELVDPDTRRTRVPFEVFEALVAMKKRSLAASRIEDADDDAVLYGGRYS